MKFKVFCVYDSKMEEFGVPMFLRSRGECLRAFTDVVKDSSSPMSKHPADYTLFEIGDYDAESASFVCYDAKVNLGMAIDFVKDRPPEIVKQELMSAHRAPNRKARRGVKKLNKSGLRSISPN